MQYSKLGKRCMGFFTHPRHIWIVYFLAAGVAFHYFYFRPLHFGKFQIECGRAPEEGIYGDAGCKRREPSQDPFSALRTCKIPNVYPFEKSGLKLIEENTKFEEALPPQCVTNPNSIFTTDGNTSLLQIGKVGRDGEAENGGICCYTPFTALPPSYTILYSKHCIKILERVTVIPEEYQDIQVLCTSNKGKTLYRDYFHFFRLNATAEKILSGREALSRRGRTDFLSVIFFGVDSVSFPNFQRHLPRSRDFLLNNLSAVEFLGLNKVGRGTLENILPVLSGCSFINGRTVFPDDAECQLIWEEFEKKGYRTVISEEQFWFLAYQNLRRNKSGTHNATYDNLAHIKGLQSTGPNPIRRFGCFEHQFAIRVLTDRVLQVARKLSGKLYYHHLWSALTSHRILEFAKYLDNPIHELLSNLSVGGLLKNTLLILYSDHGTISSDYSRTPAGLIEARLPFLYVVAPDWFRAKYTTAMSNLQRNAGGLTTPYDIHVTLRDLLNLSSIADDNMAAHDQKPSGSNSRVRERSLFSNIPLDRSCADAGVPEEYCICYSWEELEYQKDLRIVKAVGYALSVMNFKLRKHRKCSKLDLLKILGGRVRKNVTREVGMMIEVTFQTVPGYGIFSGTFTVNPKARSGEEFDLVGEIERQNLYRDQSACLEENLKGIGWIRSVCYCGK